MAIRILIILIVLIPCRLQAALRIVTYNINGGVVRADLPTVLAALGDEIVTAGAEVVYDIDGPVDLLFLQEQNPSSSVKTTQTIADRLNQICSTAVYTAGTVQPNSIGIGGSAGVVYRNDVVELLEEVAISTPGPRSPVRYKFRILGYSSSDALFYVYCCHLKAGSGDASMRAAEALAVRQNADALGADKNIIYLGDLNLYNSGEGAWQNLTTAAGDGKAVDPVNVGGTWHDNAAVKLWHTQSPRVSSSGSLVGGGMDDRFDFQLVSEEMEDGDGLAIISDSYRGFGNNGTHITNSTILTGSGASTSVLAALMNASDHLPVVAEYQIPAVMAVEVAEIPSPAVICPGYELGVAVSNIAPVAQAIEADELEYTIGTDGDPCGVWGELPGGWNTAEIGTVAPGSQSQYLSGGAVFMVDGTGSVSGLSDNFYFVYQALSGDAEFYYRLDSLEATTANAVAGLMMREDLTSNSPFAFVHLSADADIAFRRRYWAGGISMATGYTASAIPKWLKIARSGSEITTFTSDDGVAWTPFYSDTITMAADILVGFAVATFDASSARAYFSLSDASGGMTTTGTVYSDAADQERSKHQVELPTGTEGDVVTTVHVDAVGQAVENDAHTEQVSYRVTHQVDFDDDKDFDLDDINLLLCDLGSAKALYDLNFNGVVDLGDLDILVQDIMAIPYGDANLDRVVDGQDLSILLSNYLQPAYGWNYGDFNGDGVVDLEDLSKLNRNWLLP